MKPPTRTCWSFILFGVQMALAAVVGGIVAARLTQTVDLPATALPGGAFVSRGTVSFTGSGGHAMCSWALAVLAVGLLLPFGMIILQILSGDGQRPWFHIAIFVCGAFGFVWWALFAAVDTGMAVHLRKQGFTYRESERGAVWALAWAETAFYLLTMALAVLSAGGPRAFFAPSPPGSPTAKLITVVQEDRLQLPSTV